MEELLKHILENIVNNPDKIELKRVEEESVVTFEISLDDEDKGLVIGRQGRTIKAIRDILGILAARENVKVYLKIAE